MQQYCCICIWLWWCHFVHTKAHVGLFTLQFHTYSTVQSVNAAPCKPRTNTLKWLNWSRCWTLQHLLCMRNLSLWQQQSEPYLSVGLLSSIPVATVPQYCCTAHLIQRALSCTRMLAEQTGKLALSIKTPHKLLCSVWVIRQSSTLMECRGKGFPAETTIQSIYFYFIFWGGGGAVIVGPTLRHLRDVNDIYMYG